jgi:nucleoside phosphorylase
VTVLRDLITAIPSRTEFLPVPWPEGLAPVAVDPQNDGTGPLPKVKTVVMPWTAAEALATSRVLTPGRDSTDYTHYTHNFEAFAPKISHDAPAWEAQDLGAFWLSQVGDETALVLKSSLHMSQDGPDLPVADLFRQVIAETGCELIITTGTAGGVGATTLLGDVIVGDYVHFDCTETFKAQPWARASYKTSEVPKPVQLSTAVQKLIPVNASRLPNGGGSVITGDILTTDFFAFDDVENHYGLRTANRWARAVEMGDAVLGMVIAGLDASAPKWLAIRNASDPEIPQLATLAAEDTDAGTIYTDWGFTTTIASALVCWAYIAATKEPS